MRKLPSNHCKRQMHYALLILGACSAFTGCRREIEPAKAVPEPPQARSVVVFPEAIHVADAAVNAFLEMAMQRCTSGDYDAFRLLWTAREDPLPRDEFESGFEAVEEIRVQALRKAAFDTAPSGDESAPQTIYVAHVTVTLDVDQLAGRREPVREVVLMLVREHGEWRLARAPKPMRAWIKEHGGATPEAASQKSPEP